MASQNLSVSSVWIPLSDLYLWRLDTVDIKCQSIYILLASASFAMSGIQSSSFWWGESCDQAHALIQSGNGLGKHYKAQILIHFWIRDPCRVAFWLKQLIRRLVKAPLRLVIIARYACLAFSKYSLAPFIAVVHGDDFGVDNTVHVKSWLGWEIVCQ